MTSDDLLDRRSDRNGMEHVLQTKFYARVDIQETLSCQTLFGQFVGDQHLFPIADQKDATRGGREKRSVKGVGPFSRNGPEGASPKRALTALPDVDC